MSQINSIQQAPDFNEQQYNLVIEQAKTQKVDTGLVDKLLLDAIKGGKSFDQALALVGSDLPKLSQPNAQAFAWLKDWTAIPSPGALIMSITTQFAAEQRQQNRELAWAETEAIVASMKNQAEEMREQAKIQLGLGIASGVISIGAGIFQIAGSASAIKAAGDDMTKLQAANNKIMGISSIIGSAGKMFDSGSQYMGTMTQARLKDMDAEQEKMRAVRDSLRDLNDALRDLIQKSLSAQNDIQASTNQSRTKILA